MAFDVVFFCGFHLFLSCFGMGFYFKSDDSALLLRFPYKLLDCYFPVVIGKTVKKSTNSTD